ncbi:hypothetical protein ACH347_23710 [Saccharopolyspora sp. 5N102]|uniref:hypothetical protein n=1 Tax=Saccharopolyspora TaxID=1835 RepID=UPI0033CE1D03
MTQSDLGIRQLVERGATLTELLEHLKSHETFTLTPLSFLKAIQLELGISFVRTRHLLEFFDPEMRPLVDISVIEERWRDLLGGTWP